MTRSLAMSAWAALSLGLTTCGAHTGGNDETRGPRSAPIELTAELVLKRAGSPPRVLDPKRDYVAQGDTIEAFVTPEEAVFVYLAYCDGVEFALYPAGDRTLRAEARHRFKLPEPYDIDDDRVLYLIVSRANVSLASPDLAIAIAQSRQAMGRPAMDDDCAGASGDGAGSQARSPSVTPIEVRPPETAIRVVRYEMLRRP